MQDVQKRFAEGIELLRSGRADRALKVFKTILKRFPENPDTLYYVGLAHLELRQQKQALRMFQQAHATEPDNASFANAVGLCLLELERPLEAVAAFEAAVRTAPELLQARYNLGNALKTLGRFDDARREMEAALSLAPDNRDVRLLLASLCREDGAHMRAIELARPVLERNRDDARAFEELSRAMLDADDFAALNALCTAQLSHGKTLPWAYNRLMEVSLRTGDGNAATEHGAKAVSLSPESIHFRHGHAWALDVIGATDAASDEFRAVLDRQPDHKEARLRQAARAFIEDQRWDAALWASRMDQAAGITPVRARTWAGEDIAGQSLILLGEQGVGDQIMFAGLFRRAAAATSDVTVECEDRLIPLFQRSYADLAFVPWRHPPDPAVAKARFDRKLPMADLIGLGRIEPREAYLMADQGRADTLARRYRTQDAPFLVGISWQSGNAGNGPFRSIDLERWGPVLQVPGCTFVNLQYGDHAETLEAVQAACGVMIHHDPEIDPLKDLDGFAAQVAAMDAVVTVDNSTVHMAGAVGVPTALLLPIAADWRWLRAGTDSLWYQSVSLVRQLRFGDWTDVLDNAARWLRGRSGGGEAMLDQSGADL